MNKTQLVTKNHEAFADTEITHTPRRDRDGTETTCTVIWQDQEPEVQRDSDGVTVTLRARCQVLTDDVEEINLNDTITKDGEDWTVMDRTDRAGLAHMLRLARHTADTKAPSFYGRG